MTPEREAHLRATTAFTAAMEDPLLSDVMHHVAGTIGERDPAALVTIAEKQERLVLAVLDAISIDAPCAVLTVSAGADGASIDLEMEFDPATPAGDVDDVPLPHAVVLAAGEWITAQLGGQAETVEA